MNQQELRILQEELVEIIKSISITSDNHEIETMQKRAFEVIKDLGEHVDDNIEYKDSKMKILKLISYYYDGYNDSDPVDKALLKIEEAIILSSSRIKMVSVYTAASLGARLGAIFESDGQAQEVGNIGTILGAMFGGLLSVPIILIPIALIESRQTNRNFNHIAHNFLALAGESKIGLVSALGAGISVALSRIGLMPLKFSDARSHLAGSIEFGGESFNMECGESLRSGLIAAAGAGIGAALSVAIMKKVLDNSHSVSINMKNATVEQMNIQQAQNR